MRLTQIKLAGFKSFVDPTQVQVPGSLVGVVGPNGCGKSNIIDAVRWVLGESRASALRGESMQDVIFNGSTLRKPVSRASVELIFDNSLGKAAGQWSQYAEISVKRILTREGDSSYHINNTQVRRKDIQDIFMGTGLGPRAYAIIEQGMISRIIEAKPEELRVFLEEAAGISKYKDRRRETENRLADTRDNLARVSDIRQELGTQIEKLEKQAELARRFNELSGERQHKQHLLWVLRRQDAEGESQRFQREISEAVNSLEAETARLRQIEAQLEQTREEHYAAADALSAAQVELYKANSEVSRIEAEMRFISETRQRIDAQLAQFSMQRDNGQRQEGELAEAAALWFARLAEAQSRCETAAAQVDEAAARLPDLEDAAAQARRTLDERRRQLSQAEQSLQLEQTHLEHAERTLNALTSRQERLQSEQASLPQPDTALRIENEVELAALAQESEVQRGMLEGQVSARGAAQAARQIASQSLQLHGRELSNIKGRLDALRRIQSQVDENAQIHDWIDAQGLATLPRLWQKIRVADGWDVAVEAILRDRLHAIEIDDPAQLQRLLDSPPPAKVAAFSKGDDFALAGVPGLTPIADRVTVLDPRLKSIINAWLRDCYEAEGTPSPSTRTSLPASVTLVNRAGHQFTRYGIAFHAPDPADSGIFARQAEIEGLDAEHGRTSAAVDSAQAELERIELELSGIEGEVSRLAQAEVDLKQRIHEYEMRQLQLVQNEARLTERGAQLNSELEVVTSEIMEEASRKAEAESRIDEAGRLIEEARIIVVEAQQSHETASRALDDHRQLNSNLEREAQEADFAERECKGKLSEIERTVQSVGEQVAMAIGQIERLQAEVSELQDEALKQQLQETLSLRVGFEQTLTDARSRQESATSTLREAEEAKSGTEDKLQPLRDGIADARLKEQASRLSFDQFSVQLRESGVDDEGMLTLAGELRPGQKAAPLQTEINRLSNGIAELGAINMAALDELATNQERKDFLDSQAEDLSSALETLDNAIRRIDRETREMLQNTFNTVNGHFSQMFPALFGGGEAHLLMSGEEILDAGVQVIARPPGKKNSTIHLLSGGEKALTAIALVFSFFQLNPAPFCLLDEVDAPLDDANTVRFCDLVSKMSAHTQFLYISHNKITMEMATHLVGVTMQERGVSRVVAVDIDEALQLREPVAA